MPKTISTASGRDADIGTFQKTMKLFRALEKKMEEFKLTSEQKEELREDIFIMARRDLETTRHELGVTFRAMEIAEFLEKPARPHLFAGPGHDVGKVYVKDTVLYPEKYGKKFGDAEHRQMRQHPVDAFYHFLERGRLYSALIAVNHHRHGKTPYPRRLPPEARSMSQARKIQANADSKIFAIADVFDALLERSTSHLKGKQITPELVRQEILRCLPKAAGVVQTLFSKGYFTPERISRTAIFRENARVKRHNLRVKLMPKVRKPIVREVRRRL